MNTTTLCSVPEEEREMFNSVLFCFLFSSLFKIMSTVVVVARCTTKSTLHNKQATLITAGYLFGRRRERAKPKNSHIFSFPSSGCSIFPIILDYSIL